MKPFDKKKTITIVISVICGLVFSAFLLYEQRGTIGKIEIIALSMTAIVTAFIFFVIAKVANK